MSVSVQFMFDFASPNAYLAHKVIPSIEGRTRVKFEYVPILLGGLFKLCNNRSTVETYAGVKNRLEYIDLEMKRFMAQHGITSYRKNPFFPVNTLKVMRGAIVAQDMGAFERYVDAVYVAMWEQALNMDDTSQILTVLQQAGIDGAALLDKTQDLDIKNRLTANTQSAFERGAFGAPTFFVGDEIYFGKDRLRDVEEAIARSK